MSRDIATALAFFFVTAMLILATAPTDRRGDTGAAALPAYAGTAPHR